MSPEVEYALIGKSLADLKAIRERIGKLRTKAIEIGTTLCSAGEYLKKNPQYLWFQDQQLDNKFILQPRVYQRQTYPRLHFRADFDVEAMMALSSDLRSCIEEENRLCNSLASMGHPQKQADEER